MKKERNLNMDNPFSPDVDPEGNVTVDLRKVPLDEIVRIVRFRADLAAKQLEEDGDLSLFIMVITPEQRNKLVCAKEVDSTLVGGGDVPDSDIRVFTHPTCQGMFFTDEDPDQEEYDG